MEVEGQQEVAQQEETPQSLLLSEEEVSQTVNQEEQSQVELPSDSGTTEIPEKFKGKSQEEIIQAYVELEKKLGKSGEETQGGEQAPAEENSQQKTEEGPQEVTKFQEYIDKIKAGNELTEEDYTKLEELGYTKDFVDEQVEFVKYKAQQYVREVLDPVGGEELFKEAVSWAKENWPEDKIKEYNETIASVPKLAQQALVKELIDSYKAQGTEVGPIHSNTPPKPRTKGYTSETDFMNDISDSRYGKDPAYTRAVEEKMSQTDTTGWVGFSSHMGDAS